MAKPLPKEIYVGWGEGTAHGDPFLIAHESVNDLCEQGERRRVGRYELKETLEVEGVVRLTAVPVPASRSKKKQ